MSLITRCPACQTLFKVVPDQLRISGGWVRCGMCDEIFDAASHAQQESPPPSVPLASQDAEPPPAAPGPLPGGPVASSVDHTTALVVSAAVEVEIEATAPVSHAEWASANEVAESVPLPAPAVSFMKGAKGQSTWHKPWVRATLAVACIGMLLGLSLQVVLQERNWLAASMPQVRPALMAICASLDCTISPLQQIESIVIESSAFSRVRGEVYRLSFTVKNNAGMDLAVPTLELTLTDAQDQGVMRRVFTPSELVAPSNVLAAESDWTGAVSVSVRPVAGSGAERIAGYRLLAFYP